MGISGMAPMSEHVWQYGHKLRLSNFIVGHLKIFIGKVYPCKVYSSASIWMRVIDLGKDLGFKLVHQPSCRAS